MSIEFIIERHTGVEERLDRDELIAELADDYRYALQNGIDDQVSEFESQLADLNDDDLATEYRDRTGELVMIEESEEEQTMTLAEQLREYVRRRAEAEGV